MADILIRGMEMPENCTECPCFSQWDNCGINHEWKFADEFDKTKDRLPSCPLVPIPEGHGRLGDLDALLREHGLGKDCENCDRNTRDCNYDICLSRMDVCGWIDDAPTVVPAEGGNADGN